MKIRVDENISRRIVWVIRDLAIRDGWELSHVRDVHERRTADETWIPRFAQEGGFALISGDRKIRARPHQIAAIRESGLVCIFLSPDWATAQRTIQAASLLYWWKKIESKLLEAQPGECWLVPFEFVDKELIDINIAYEKVSRRKSE